MKNINKYLLALVCFTGLLSAHVKKIPFNLTAPLN
jgi:hypothetical protein